MENFKCADCPMRAKHDANPSSIAGRLWRWHINLCPGWKGYFNSLGPAEKSEIRQKYNFTKYR